MFLADALSAGALAVAELHQLHFRAFDRAAGGTEQLTERRGDPSRSADEKSLEEIHTDDYSATSNHLRGSLSLTSPLRSGRSRLAMA